MRRNLLMLLLLASAFVPLHAQYSLSQLQDKTWFSNEGFETAFILDWYMTYSNDSIINTIKDKGTDKVIMKIVVAMYLTDEPTPSFDENCVGKGKNGKYIMTLQKQIKYGKLVTSFIVYKILKLTDTELIICDVRHKNKNVIRFHALKED